MSSFTRQQLEEIRALIKEAASPLLTHQQVDARLKSSRHEAGDHLDRALAPIKITPGQAGQALRTLPVAATSGGVIAKWSDLVSPYYAGLYLANSGTPTHNAGGAGGAWQNVADGGGTDSWTAICDVRPSGVAAQLDTDSGDGTITIQKTGIYLVSYKATVVVGGAGVNIGAGFSVDGTLSGIASDYSGAAGSFLIGATEMWSLTAGNVLNLMAFQNSGGNLNYFTAYASANRLSVLYLGPSS